MANTLVKLTSFLVLFTLTIAPAFAWDLETRDITEVNTIFVRDMDGLFVRQQDFEHPDLARRFVVNWSRIANAGKAAVKIGSSALLFARNTHESSVAQPQYTAQDLLPHRPPSKHEFVGRDFDDELLERDLDYELYIRDLTDEDLFERFYDDLD